LLELNSDGKGVLFLFVYVLDNKNLVPVTQNWLHYLFVMHMLIEDKM